MNFTIFSVCLYRKNIPGTGGEEKLGRKIEKSDLIVCISRASFAPKVTCASATHAETCMVVELCISVDR